MNSLIPRELRPTRRPAKGAIAKACGCCAREFTEAHWLRLPFVGRKYGVELRNCPCLNTLARTT